MTFALHFCSRTQTKARLIQTIFVNDLVNVNYNNNEHDFRYNKNIIATQEFTLMTTEETCIWPNPPGLDQSDPERSFCQQGTGEVREDVIIEDGQTAVVRQTSVDCCEPVDSLSVNLVTCRVMCNSATTTRLCSHKCTFVLMNSNYYWLTNWLFRYNGYFVKIRHFTGPQRSAMLSPALANKPQIIC